MQVKRPSTHPSPSAGRSRPIRDAAGPDGAEDQTLAEPARSERRPAGRGPNASPGRRRARSADVDAAAPKVGGRRGKGQAGPQAAATPPAARPPMPKPRRARAATAAAESPAEMELALSIVEMGEALGAAGAKYRGGRGRASGQRARTSRRAAQAFVDGEAVADVPEGR